MLSVGLLKLQTSSRCLTRRFVKVFEKQGENIEIRTKPLSIKEYSSNSYTRNYNLEENQKFTKKVQEAKEQRNMIEQLEAKEIVPRRLRRIYDKPKYDTDITK